MNEQQEKWLQQVEALFLRYGIKSLTMDDVARELGISKKTLYQFVENKDDLVKKTLLRHIELEKNMCDHLFAQADNALEEIRIVLESNATQIAQMKANIVFDLQRYHRDTWNIMVEYQHHFLYQVVRENLERGIREGLYRSNFDIDIMTKLHIQASFQLFDEQLFPFEKYPRTTVFREYMMAYLYGVVSEKGRKVLEQMFPVGQ